MLADAGIGVAKISKSGVGWAKNAVRAERTAAEIATESSEIAYSASNSSGKIAAESTQITKESVMRALRQSNTPEGAATAKLLKRGKVELKILDSVPQSIAKQVGTDIRGFKASIGNTINIIKPNLTSIREAAGVTAHETKHWLQIRAGQSASSKLSEFEAFQWSMKVDGTTYPRTTKEIYNMVNNHPIYKNKEPFGWKR
jgi:hypothetical protein